MAIEQCNDIVNGCEENINKIEDLEDPLLIEHKKVDESKEDDSHKGGEKGSIEMVLLSIAVVVCGSFEFGLCVGYSAPTQSAIRENLDLSLAEYSLSGSFVAIGAMVGAITSGQISDSIGRKWAMRLSSGCCIIGWLAVYFSMLMIVMGASTVYLLGTLITWRLLALTEMAIELYNDIANGHQKNNNGVLEDLENPLLSEDKKAEEYDSQKAGEKGSIRMVLLSTAVAVCGSFEFGSCVGYSAPTQSAIREDLGLSLAEYSLFGSILPIGAMVGAIASGQISDSIGRKWAMRLSSACCIIGWLAVYFSMGALVLDVGRFLTGYGIGIFSFVVPVFIAEIAPTNLRGGLTTLNQLMIVTGSSTAFLLGTLITWRLLALTGLIPCIVLLFGLLFIPESPRWLAKIGKQEEFEAALGKLRGKDADVSREKAEIQAYIETLQSLPKSQMLDLFDSKYIRCVIIGVGLMIFQQFGGINAMGFYASEIFEEAGISGNAGTIAYAIIQVPITIVGAILMDKSGRRPLLIVSAIGEFLGCFLTGTSFFLEIFPIHVKGIAGSLVTLVSWLGAWVVSYTFNFLLSWSSPEMAIETYNSGDNGDQENTGTDDLENPLLIQLKKVDESEQDHDYSEKTGEKGSISIVLLSTVVAVCGSFEFGSCIGYSAPTETAIREDLNQSLAEYSLFGSILAIGAMVGGITSGQISDYIGRKGLMVVIDSSIAFLLGTVITWRSLALTATYQNSEANPGENDPTNTTVGILFWFWINLFDNIYVTDRPVVLWWQILVDGFEANVSDDSLRQVFGQFGELVHVKIPAHKRYGFVQFADSHHLQPPPTIPTTTHHPNHHHRHRPHRPPPPPATTHHHHPPPPATTHCHQPPSLPPPTAHQPPILVDGFEENVSDDSLRQVFGQFGELVHVKIPAHKRYGFVQFADRACAEQALLVVNGTQIGGANVRLSWGHSPNKQAQSDQTQWNNGAYFGYGAQGYEATSGSYLSPSECDFLAKCIDEVEFKRIMASRDDVDDDLSDLIGDDGVQNLDNMEARFPTIIHLIEGSGSYLSPSECDFLAECIDLEEFNRIMAPEDYLDYDDYDYDLSDLDDD
ncbi:hypothetical protein Vadar_034393 [Vaccinium darrowii]|uniref:Uncharacterized protein n=1 Tax=Vaccinium darrowii TaxID=229202 RepID=A0ACB7Z0K4_9ERIC|nr:hypothetical protein Vadar_034393 [Vaccinium darrowii]